MTPFSERAVLTPLGVGTCWAATNEDSDDIEWVVIINATGEPWQFRSPEIRFLPSVTDGRPPVSPFMGLSEATKKQIERYKQNGWL